MRIYCGGYKERFGTGAPPLPIFPPSCEENLRKSVSSLCEVLDRGSPRPGQSWERYDIDLLNSDNVCLKCISDFEKEYTAWELRMKRAIEKAASLVASNIAVNRMRNA